MGPPLEMPGCRPNKTEEFLDSIEDWRPAIRSRPQVEMSFENQSSLFFDVSTKEY
jgi:hypothetical protein